MTYKMNGIAVDISLSSEEAILSNIKKGSYDLVLADVNLNQVPSTSFLSEYMYITDELSLAYDKLCEEKDINNIQNLFKEYIQILSEDVSAIGIYAKVGYVVTQKSLLDMSNISYMKIFDMFN